MLVISDSRNSTVDHVVQPLPLLKTEYTMHRLSQPPETKTEHLLLSSPSSSLHHYAALHIWTSFPTIAQYCTTPPRRTPDIWKQSSSVDVAFSLQIHGDLLTYLSTAHFKVHIHTWGFDFPRHRRVNSGNHVLSTSRGSRGWSVQQC